MCLKLNILQLEELLSFGHRGRRVKWMLIMKLQLPDNSVSFNRGVKGFRVFEMEGMLWKQSSVNILFSLQVLKLWKKGKEFLKSRAAWVELASGKSYKQLSFLIPKMKFSWKLNFCPTGNTHSKSTCHSWYLWQYLRIKTPEQNCFCLCEVSLENNIAQYSFGVPGIQYLLLFSPFAFFFSSSCSGKRV